jgi:YidC/Oxa1 family membrane protein insertase
MDRKAILVVSTSIVLLLFWPTLVQKLYPPQPVPATVASQSGRQSNGPAALSPTASAATTNVGTSAPATAVSVPATIAPLVRPGTAEETLVVSNALVRYTFTSHGGGLKSAELLRFPESVACNVKVNPGALRVATLNQKAPVAAMSLMGESILQGDGVFTLTRTATGVRAEKRLPGDLSVVKDFQIGSNYMVECIVRMENRSAVPIPLGAHEVVIGTATPMDPLDDGSKVGVYWGRDHKVEHVTVSWFKNPTLGCLPGGTPRTVYQEGSSNVTWAAVHNQFFAMVAIPRDPALQVVSREQALPSPSPEDLALAPRANTRPLGYQTSLVYPPVAIPPNQALERRFSIYAGPKEYSLLARLGAEFHHDLDQVMGFDQVLFGSFSGFFAKMLLLAMNAIHALGINYGFSIVVITVVIKLLFWPLTQASTRSMKRMQALQPQMKALQEKYKEDPAKLNRKMMEFWKENKVSPFGGCLPILLQMPVFIGFFAMIQTAIELRGASFLWACDLTKPDTLFLIPYLQFPFNPMPLLMGATMLWQARMQPVAPGVDPMQANMMKYMPLMFLVMLYNFSSGLTLYWTVQNLLSILQMKLTRAQDAKAAPKPSTPILPPGNPRKKH